MFIITACEAYGATFQKIPNHVEGAGDMYETTTSLSNCKALCINPPTGGICRSYEYWRLRNICTLTDHTMLYPVNGYDYNTDWDVYTRDCA